MLRLEQHLTQKQIQTLTLSQQQILGLNMLQMNALELEQFLEQQVEQNPLLELDRPEPAPIESPDT
ncbi:MAG TPA: RNA polymerase sigma-54 factor, partial [Candidatus Hydrogenedentes bacterium]|nr:RNA polymerase sigma-54 factor [Candidatus Hydrogenedentota bacterium]